MPALPLWHGSASEGSDMGVFDFIQNPSRPRYSGDEYYTLSTKDLSEDSPMRALALTGIPGALVYYAYAQPRTLLTALAGTLEEPRLREARSLSGGFYSIMGGDTGAWLIAPIPVRHFDAETLSLSPSALLVGVDSATTDLVEKTLESISSCDKCGRTSLLRNKFGVEIVQGIVSIREDEITGPARSSMPSVAGSRYPGGSIPALREPTTRCR